MDAPITITVGTTATELTSTQRATIVVQSTEGDFYVGGPGVTTANGILVSQYDTFSIDIRHGETLYGVAPAAVTVRILRSV